MDRLLEDMLEVKLHFSYWKDNAVFPDSYNKSGIIEDDITTVQDTNTGVVMQLPDKSAIEDNISNVNGFDAANSDDIVGQLTPQDSRGNTSAKVLVTANVNTNTLMYQSLKNASVVIEEMMPCSMEGSWEYVKTDESKVNSNLSTGRNEWVISVFTEGLEPINLGILEEGVLEEKIKSKTPPVTGSISPDISSQNIAGITIFTRTDELHKDSMDAIIESVEELASEKSVDIEGYALSIR